MSGSTTIACSPSALDVERTPPRPLRLDGQDYTHHDIESLARAIASRAQSSWDSEAIEIAYAIIKAADALQMSVSTFLTGGMSPLPEQYGPPRILADGRRVTFSTVAVPSPVQREIAGRCLIGAIADPALFWALCRFARLDSAQTQELARYAAIADYTDTERVAGLARCARAFSLKLEDVLTLRLWW